MPRTLVVCLDGTWSQYEDHNTNVVWFFSTLKKDDPDTQVCYYQPGIGTFFAPGVVSPLFEWAAKLLDAGIAWYLDVHVMEAYSFLMQNYRAGDRICLFGFSRGAYCARALAGMLHKIGLLPRDNHEQVLFAYKLYKREDKAGVELARGFKQTFCHNVRVEFLGAWETVSSVGVVVAKTLPFTNSNRSIKTFRHALALDEHRVRFKANLFHRPFPAKAKTKSWTICGFPIKSPDGDQDPEDDDNGSGWTETDIKEVWFSGCHSDVGGGSFANTDKTSLSHVTLRWMVSQVMEADCGISFLDNVLESIGIEPKPSQKSDPRDSADVMAPIHDSLTFASGTWWQVPFWWMLEIVPMTSVWQDAKGDWHKDFGWNIGQGRDLSAQHPLFHTSVRERMKKGNYKPKAKYKEAAVTWVQ
ncbi:hypothetical protein CYLTODRAFT_366733 [Cylindrobasidium torrendii FP15055 ss-10]|uniref:T6SS Phospholipase effector Tle1-like catalytic domain-containing protein n=1 Tax=Cylindrobasidium torrendii FP15055 ss-10 TaxID=1314674 RepID=A0A0D7BRT4_9AGAR|nr:hypothetical protein CYLTODRAFT_366733 [Cylindrobasidium torrendii FP15055 ss-10]